MHPPSLLLPKGMREVTVGACTHTERELTMQTSQVTQAQSQTTATHLAFLVAHPFSQVRFQVAIARSPQYYHKITLVIIYSVYMIGFNYSANR